MVSLQKKLESVLENGLKDGKTELETLSNAHVCGHVISSEFVDQSYEDRRKRIREIMEEHLENEELLKVSTLLMYTPEEWAFESTQSSSGGSY